METICLSLVISLLLSQERFNKPFYPYYLHINALFVLRIRQVLTKSHLFCSVNSSLTHHDQHFRVLPVMFAYSVKKRAGLVLKHYFVAKT